MSLESIPVEVFLDNLLPLLSLPDLAHLATSDKFFGALASDETFWKRKCEADFNFTGAGTARTSGWKFIYSGLSKPRVYVWGHKANGRLGLSKIPRTPLRDVSFPTQLRVQDARVVSVAAAGMSYHALDSEGRVFVWGTLNGDAHSLRSDGYSEPGKTAHSPLRLELPTAIRSISCGRLHAASLDVNNYIWNFQSWGRPFRLTSPLLRGNDAVPIQVECGWAFSAALSKSGSVYVWWPTHGVMNAAITARNTAMDGDRETHDASKGLANDDGVILCAPWDLDIDPVVLPPLPALPELNPSTDEDVYGISIIQIAAYDGALVALTNKGHVLKFGSLDNDTSVSSGVWEYLPQFSESSKLRAVLPNGSDLPTAFKITHVSAHFNHFIAYTASTVLIGGPETTTESPPQVIPELQKRSVISVVLGDYHYAAVTADGKLLTWGAYSQGALGLGDPSELPLGSPGAFVEENERQMAISRERGTPPDVKVPTQVRFDHRRKSPKDRFCISATASGWHTAALVIDLKANEEDENSDTEGQNEKDGPLLDTVQPHMPLVPNMAPFRGGLPHFRVGFAGRGMNRGGLMGRGRGRGDGA